ncbi:hypothetical protein B0H14DRAFT_2647642 [Mycena olivaceomarginata]|nr:hypothetical protein B0H14DRAFT_2647642 [Mycena olivaceomarginata]
MSTPPTNPSAQTSIEFNLVEANTNLHRRCEVAAEFKELLDHYRELTARYKTLASHSNRLSMCVPCIALSPADVPQPRVLQAEDNKSSLHVNPGRKTITTSMATNDIDEYNDEEAALQEIDRNCSRDEALKALRDAQLYGMKLLAENRKLREDNSNLRASAPKKRCQNEDFFGYKGEVVGLAKRFLLTRAFIVDRASFQKQKPLPPTKPQDQFTSDKAYTTSMAIALYEEIPTKFHPLLDVKTYSNFATDFIHEHSDGRSSFLNALRKALPVILNGLNIDSNIVIKARADRSKDPILAGLLKFPDERKPSRFPPVLFPSSNQNMNEAFTGAYFLRTHRLMYFGPGSLASKAKPALNSNGIKLGFKEVTSSSMAAAGIALRVVLSPDESWQPKGTASGINWEAEYRAYLEMFESNKDRPHIKRIFKTVHNFVFAGVDTAIQSNADDSDDGDDVAELMRRFELGTDDVVDRDNGSVVTPVASAPPSPVPSVPSPLSSVPSSPVAPAPPLPVVPVADTQVIRRGRRNAQVVLDSEVEPAAAGGGSGSGPDRRSGAKTSGGKKRK